MPHSEQFSLAACGPALEPMVATLLPHARQPRESCTRKPMIDASADDVAVSADDDNGGSEGKRSSCIMQPQSRRPLGTPSRWRLEPCRGKASCSLSKSCRLRGCLGLGYIGGANLPTSPVVEVEGFEPSRAVLSGRCPASFATPKMRKRPCLAAGPFS